ncbi:MAG: hypothetical protein GC164_13005 [Phycisphaera sp.]|nr:hypothetical protein [Phycisphaera sp.]
MVKVFGQNTRKIPLGLFTGNPLFILHFCQQIAVSDTHERVSPEFHCRVHHQITALQTVVVPAIKVIAASDTRCPLDSVLDVGSRVAIIEIEKSNNIEWWIESLGTGKAPDKPHDLRLLRGSRQPWLQLESSAVVLIHAVNPTFGNCTNISSDVRPVDFMGPEFTIDVPASVQFMKK